MSRAEHQARKELLIAQAAFDRIKFANALREVRRISGHALEPQLRTQARSSLARMLRFVLPALGASRVGRIVRALSIATSLYRFMLGFAAASEK